MKAALIILALLTAGSGWLFLQKSSALQEAEARLASNDVSRASLVKQFQTELMLTNLSAGDIQSNLQQRLETRTAHLLVFSNRLVQANLLLQSAQQDARAAQAEARHLAAGNAVLAARQEELDSRLQAIPRLEGELGGSRRQNAETARERDRLAAELQAVRVELAGLQGKLEDPAFLRNQLGKTEDNLALRRKAAAGALRASDPRLPLQLQADGSVRTAPPPKS
jgi:small-conductance mechanosensitive channel